MLKLALGPYRTCDTWIAARVCPAQTDHPPLPPRAAKEKLSEERPISYELDELVREVGKRFRRFLVVLFCSTY